MKSKRVLYFFLMLCTTMFFTLWLQSASIMQSTAELETPFNIEHETRILRYEPTESHSTVTPLSWSRNRKRLGGLELKEHSGGLKSCIGFSEIPDLMLKTRKGETTRDHVNAEIFGAMTHEAIYASNIANKTLPSILAKRRNSTKGIASPIDQMMVEMKLAVDVGEYQLLPGGHWVPRTCRPIWKVAIIVGFRNRFQHLPIFLRHIVPLLKRQKLEFSIFISEQRNDLPFNKAMLMNIGFVEAQEFNDFDCVVFHDVDHLALNIRNYYGCENMPKHFESGEPKWDWKLLYNELFGGAVGVTTSQFHVLIGFSNVYWGWGGEDDDFYNRVVANGYDPFRPEGKIGYFDTLEHGGSLSSRLNIAKFCLRIVFAERMSADGLSNLEYDQPTIELHPLYTNISVDIQRLPWNPEWTKCEMIVTTILVMTVLLVTLTLIVTAVTVLRFLRKDRFHAKYAGIYRKLEKKMNRKEAV